MSVFDSICDRLNFQKQNQCILIPAEVVSHITTSFMIAGGFSCEVENDGKVSIRGVTTTGEKTVCRYSQVFEMQTQNLCPPGHFSISFKLPGPVDPQQFSGNFGTDGILEGIVMKGRDTR